uniref:hypothetical protein n=1 Tax=Streptomyces sp. TR1341 TaxID=2601266 RepID=UPI00138B0BEA
MEFHAGEDLAEGVDGRRVVPRRHRGLRLDDERGERVGAARPVELLAARGDLFVHPGRALEVSRGLDGGGRRTEVLEPVLAALVAERQAAGDLGVALTCDVDELMVGSELLLGGLQHVGERAQRGRVVAGLLLPIAHVAQQGERRLGAVLPLGDPAHGLVPSYGLLRPPRPAVPVGQLMPGQLGVPMARSLVPLPIGQ